MPYLGCKKCHHEWEGNKNSKCDWCGGPSRILEDETPLEKCIDQTIKQGRDPFKGK